MKRLYEPAAYGPQGACFWSETVDRQTWGRLNSDRQVDVAIIGGGFTGLSAALHLAQGGTDVLVLEAEHPGYGASGRNGGFCCLGGAKASDGMLRRRFGEVGLAQWRDTEKAAIETVDTLIAQFDLQVDRHSDGETLMAHSPRAWRRMRAEAENAGTPYGAPATILPQSALRQNGLNGPWFGAMTLPFGFALNPGKYHAGLARAAINAGADLRSDTPVTSLTRQDGAWRLQTRSHATVRADQVIVATNGYSSEDIPDWLRSRTLPVLSNIIVTRPLEDAELRAQGWTSHQMAYDTRTLLHYFRLMPNRRFLFGMRGGLRATASAQATVSKQIRQDFARLFPAWAAVDITHEWSGLACLMARLTPFVGPVPGHAGLLAGLGFHGNGVAMGTHAGRILADLALGQTPSLHYAGLMRLPPKRFPFGRYRRALLRPAYAMARLMDI